MAKVSLFNVSGEQLGEIELNDSIFGSRINRYVVHDVMVRHLAGKRLGTSDTKTRSEISGGGRKPWRQKGTGRARHGSTRSPIWRGGGVVFGPHPRDYSFTIPKKIRRLALKSVLSSKVEEGKVLILDELSLERPRTKEILSILSNLKVAGKALMVTDVKDEAVFKSAGNIPGIKPVTVEGLNVYDLLVYETLIITKSALTRVEEVLCS